MLSNNRPVRGVTVCAGAAELFSKVQGGNAQEGWVSLELGTEVQGTAIIWPKWYHKVWGKLSAWIGRAT